MGFDPHPLGAISRLVSALAAGGTAISITAGTGALFTDPATAGAYNLTIVKAAADGSPQLPVFFSAGKNAERVRFTAKAGDGGSITRAQETTTAIAFSAGDYVYAAIGPLDFTNIQYSIPLNVKMYGATGDGATDDSAAVQAAFNALPTAGGTVYFPSGTYKLQSTVTMPASKKVELRGEGWASVVTGDAAIIFSAASDVDPQTGGQITVKDLMFSATKTSAAQKIFSLDVTYVAGDSMLPFYFEGCYFYLNGHVGTIGIYAHGISDAGIHNCFFLSDGGELAIATYVGIGISLFGDASAALNVEISGCEFMSLDQAIIINGVVEGIRIEDCSFVGCITENMLITGNSALLVQIIGCMVDSSHANCVDIANANSVYMLGNWFSPNQNGIAGVSLTAGAAAPGQIIIVGNEFVSSAGSPGNAIALDSTGHAFKNVVIEGNVIRGWAAGVICGGAGISNMAVLGNVFAADTTGINLGSVVSNFLIEHNLFDSVTTRVSNIGSWKLKVVWSSSAAGNNVRWNATFDEVPVAGASSTSLLSANQTEAAAGSANNTVTSTFTFTTNPTTGALKLSLARLGADGADTNVGTVSVWEAWLESPSGQKVALMLATVPAFSTDAHGSLSAHEHFHLADAATTFLNYTRAPVDGLY